MLKKNIYEIKSQDVTMANSKKTSIQWLVAKEDGAKNFALRRFSIGVGGKIGLHDHKEEHEIFVLSGNGITFTKDEEYEIRAEDVLFVPPNEPHGYKNIGNTDLVFLCVIPLLD